MDYSKAFKICSSYLKDKCDLSHFNNFVFNVKDSELEYSNKFMKIFIEHLNNISSDTAEIIKLTIFSYVVSSNINKTIDNDFYQLIDYCFDNTYKLISPIVVYRGISDIKHLNTSLYISTTLDILLANNFAQNGIVLQIVLPIGTKVLYNNSEHEFIIKGKLTLGKYIGNTYSRDEVPMYECNFLEKSYVKKDWDGG